MVYLSLKYCEKKILFLKVVIDAIKMSMTFLFFAFFSHSVPAKSPPDPRDHYPNPEDLRPFPP